MDWRDNHRIKELPNTASKALMLGCGIILIWYLSRNLVLTAYGEYSATVVLSIWFRFPVEVLLHSSIVPMLAASSTPDRVASTLIRATFAMSLIAAILALIAGPHGQGLTSGQYCVFCSP
jgi:hypothetical protein